MYSCSLGNTSMSCYMESVSLSDFHVEIRVQEAIAEVAAELNPDGSAQQQSKAIQKVKRKARKILQEMVATVSPGMIRYFRLGSLEARASLFPSSRLELWDFPFLHQGRLVNRVLMCSIGKSICALVNGHTEASGCFYPCPWVAAALLWVSPVLFRWPSQALHVHV